MIYLLTEVANEEQKQAVLGVLEEGEMEGTLGFDFTVTSKEGVDPRQIAALPDLLKLLREGLEVVSGLEAEADNAGIGDLRGVQETRFWWTRVEDWLHKLGCDVGGAWSEDYELRGDEG